MFVIRSSSIPFGTLVVLCSAALAGCGSEEAATGTITGQITYDSQPVTTGTVVYENSSRAWISVAEIDGAGRYQLPEIRVAEYTVSIQPPEPKLPNESTHKVEELRALQGSVKIPDPKNIPRPVRSTQTSPLRASVVAGDQEINFELPSATRS